MTSTTFDYVIVGGGTAGCVLASRLKQSGNVSVAIIERGSPDYDHELIQVPLKAPLLNDTDFQSRYQTTKQAGLANREILNIAGNVLSGSSAVNYGMWTRGNRADYDAWAEKVGDQKWSYKNMETYFKRAEHHWDVGADADTHGSDGPIWTTSGRSYGVRSAIEKAYLSAGVRDKGGKRDLNDGNNIGICQYVENWRDGKRQPAYKAYNMDGVQVETRSMAKRILFRRDEGQDSIPTATGVEVVDGRVFTAQREVIISCGAFRTPQLLMLSGIGPAAELHKHNIPLLVDAPGVGQNFSDHLGLGSAFRLRHPEANLALGSAGWADTPSNMSGMPIEFLVLDSCPRDELIQSLKKDGVADPEHHPLFKQDRPQFKILSTYGPIGISERYKMIPDGTHIALIVWNTLPTSRGQITLSSTVIADQPIIDPRYVTTETDRYIMRHAIRRAHAVAETPSFQSIVSGETPPEDFPVLSSKSTDEEIDRRVQEFTQVFHHASGTAAMGSVVDTDLRVKGVRGLRVCDASVFPDPLAAAYQAPVYALAEHGADIILERM